MTDPNVVQINNVESRTSHRDALEKTDPELLPPRRIRGEQTRPICRLVDFWQKQNHSDHRDDEPNAEEDEGCPRAEHVRVVFTGISQQQQRGVLPRDELATEPDRAAVLAAVALRDATEKTMEQRRLQPEEDREQRLAHAHGERNDEHEPHVAVDGHHRIGRERHAGVVEGGDDGEDRPAEGFVAGAENEEDEDDVEREPVEEHAGDDEDADGHLLLDVSKTVFVDDSFAEGKFGGIIIVVGIISW